MFAFDSSNQTKKSLRDDLKAIGISDATLSASSPEDLSIGIASINAVAKDSFIFENVIDDNIPIEDGNEEQVISAQNMFFEICFANGQRISWRSAKGTFSIGCSYGDTYVALSADSNLDFEGGAVDIIRLREYLRSDVPVFGTFATAIDAKGVRRVFTNADITFAFKDNYNGTFSVNTENRPGLVRRENGCILVDAASWC